MGGEVGEVGGPGVLLARNGHCWTFIPVANGPGEEECDAGEVIED